MKERVAKTVATILHNKHHDIQENNFLQIFFLSKYTYRVLRLLKKNSYCKVASANASFLIMRLIKK